MSTKSIIPPKSRKVVQGEKLRGAQKMERIPVKILPTEREEMLKKPSWLRVRLSYSSEVDRIKTLLRKNKLHSVCEEASCPNLNECFSNGTATFMIMGDICTRRCAFCDVAHGRPNALDPEEPYNLAKALGELHLQHVVITSVDRDDLRDGGAAHFASCIVEIRKSAPSMKIEILTPDFRGRMQPALDILSEYQPDVFNHNVETVPDLYRMIRPGSNYAWSLQLLHEYKKQNPNVVTKSGLMLGLGETNEQIIKVMEDMRRHEIDMVTLGQYLQPSRYHAPVKRYVHPDEFASLANTAKELGFMHVASGALVRSSYHADRQVEEDMVV